MMDDTAIGAKTIRLREDLHARLKSAAALAGRTLEDYLAEVVEKALEGERR